MVFQPRVPAQSDSDPTKCFSTCCPFRSATEGTFVKSGRADGDGYLMLRQCLFLRCRKKQSFVYVSYVQESCDSPISLWTRSCWRGPHARRSKDAVRDKLISSRAACGRASPYLSSGGAVKRFVVYPEVASICAKFARRHCNMLMITM